MKWPIVDFLRDFLQSDAHILMVGRFGQGIAISGSRQNIGHGAHFSESPVFAIIETMTVRHREHAFRHFQGDHCQNFNASRRADQLYGITFTNTAGNAAYFGWYLPKLIDQQPDHPQDLQDRIIQMLEFLAFKIISENNVAIW